MQKLMGLVRRCVEDYDMIRPGDRITVGVSGGKDSLTLLTALAGLRRFYPAPFEVEAITLDLGFEGADFSRVGALCQRLEVPYTVVKTQIKQVVFDQRQEKNPCSMCAKMRRGALNSAALERGSDKIALGHHYDDAVETFMLSLLFEGRISCFQPVTDLDRSGVIQIRPMLYVGEKMIQSFAERESLPVVFNPCPADKHTRREEVKRLVAELGERFPGFKSHVFGGMQRLPLPHWEPVFHRRRPLPESDD